MYHDCNKLRLQIREGPLCCARHAYDSNPLSALMYRVSSEHFGLGRDSTLVTHHLTPLIINLLKFGKMNFTMIKGIKKHLQT